MARDWNCAEMQEYVLDLSISLRTGEETNLDFFSSGERTRKSSNGNTKLCRVVKNLMERRAKGGDSPRKPRIMEE